MSTTSFSYVNGSEYKEHGLTFSGYISTPFFFEPPVEIGHKTSLFYNVRIGMHSYINSGIIRENTKIGRYCSIADGVVIGAGNHAIDMLSTHPFAAKCNVDYEHGFPYRKYSAIESSTDIGHDVWLGVNSVIIQGIKIGTGAIIAAGAVVTKDVPPYAIVGGVPAKIIRYRFPDDLIAGLLDSEWWKIPIDVLQSMPINNIKKCIELSGENSRLKIGSCFIEIK